MRKGKEHTKAALDLDGMVKDLPHCPGVYCFLDHKGNILYIGKARDLRKRVVSYSNPHSWQIPEMLENAVRLDYTQTSTEREALILEASMVRHHKPKYNIKLKDDKRFPYLKITKERYPRLLYVRRPANDHAMYFGPFTFGPIRKTERFVRRLFKLRPCKRMAPRGCVYGDIGVCLAPCRGDCTEGEYMEAVAQAKMYLSGDHRALTLELEGKMKRHSDDMEFEKAAILRDQLKAVTRLAAEQRVDFMDPSSKDAIVLSRISPKRAIVLHYSLRKGLLVAKKNFKLDVQEKNNSGQILRAFISQYYGAADPPPEILLHEPVEDRAVLEDWLSSIRGKRVRFRVPRKGILKRLIDMMRTNLCNTLASLYTDGSEEDLYDRTSKDLKRDLGLDNPPRSIEAFDISTIQGRYSVGAKVRFDDGRPNKSGYRRYRIKHVKGQDDFAMIKEVLTRRISHVDDDPLPDLFVIDGGKGQLGSALAAAVAAGVKTQIISLAKREEEIFSSRTKDPILISDDEPSKQLLIRLRDEAHRFAIRYHRTVRSKGQIISALDRISGLGDDKKAALLRRFYSVKGIKAASEGELQKVSGIGPVLARRIKQLLR